MGNCEGGREGGGGGTDGSLNLVELQAAGKALLGQEARLRDRELVQLSPVLLTRCPITAARR